VNNKVILEGLEVWKIDGRVNTGQIGTGTYLVKMVDEKGLMDVLTVYGTTAGGNVNAAPKEVLMAVSPGIDSAGADQILQYRENQEIKNMAEVEGIIGQKLIQLLPLRPTSSDIFTIEAYGYKKKPRSGPGLRATISLQGTSKYKFLYFKTPVFLKKEKPEAS
jgi:hypothetical protein